MVGGAATTAERREPLSRERVIRAAMELADGEGLSALSMRVLARKLGVEAMSLYHYVERKEELLAELAALVMAEIEFPASRPGEWKAAIRQMAVSYHAALRRHRWIHEVRASPLPVDLGTLTYMEWLLGTLRKAGFSTRMTHHGYHIIEGHITGSAMWEAGIAAALSKRSLAEMAKSLEAYPVAEYPYVHEHAQEHIGKLTKGDKQPFELGLDLILDGLEDLRDRREP